MIGILINCRLQSIRLPRKHLMQINGEPILSFLIGSIQREFAQEISDGKVRIIIATNSTADNISEFSKFGVNVGYGNERNIPLRQLEIAEGFGLDHVISIDGDDIACYPEGMRLVYERLLKGKDYVRTTGLPFGMNCFGYSTKFLCDKLFELTPFPQKLQDKAMEENWGELFHGKNDEVIEFEDYQQEVKYSLDTDEDFAMFRELLEERDEKIE